MTNLQKRTLSGIGFVIVMVGCILFSSTTYCLLFATITALLLNEFNTLLGEHHLAEVNNTVSVVSGVYLFIAFFLYCSGQAGEAVFGPYVLSLIYILVSELYLRKSNPIADWVYTFAGHLWLALPMALMNVLAFDVIYSPVLPLAVFVMLWLNDAGAYIVGSALRHKIPYRLFRSISPNKSWVGSIGGGLIVVIGSVIFYLNVPDSGLWFWIGLGLVVCVFGTWGDLVESQVKRTLKIKDSGRFLPGHGGVLDRFDSALLAIPAVAFYISLFAW